VFKQCNWTSQDIDTFLILKKILTPSQAILDCHKNIYLSFHLRYLDKIWFAYRLWPSEGSDINKCETGNSIASIWTSYRFIKMAAAAAQYYFRFRIYWYRYLQKVKVYEQTKFRRHISIDDWYITTSVFEKQTSAILEIYFRFRFRPFSRNLHIILHQATEFCPNRSTHCKNMTSYPFLKMAAATAEYYFRFRICWCHCLQKVKVYWQTKFCQDISNGGWDIFLW